MKIEDLTFPEAVTRLAERAHIPLQGNRNSGQNVSSNKKARLKAVCTEAAEFYHVQLMRSPEAEAGQARSYLASRGFGGDVPKFWRLGYAPGQGKLVRHLSAKGFSPDEIVESNVGMRTNEGDLRDRFYRRIMFPIHDELGECIAFGGRVITKSEPKYLNTQETPIFHKSKVLFGLDKAKATMASTGIAIIVEGYTDVIALHEAGMKNVVATLGTALTLRHIRLLARHAQHRIVYLFDGDEAGQRAADRALNFIDESMTPEAGRYKVELAAATLPDNLDPAEFVASRGPETMLELIKNAQPLLKYGIERRLSRHDLSSAEGRSRALVDALGVLAPIKDSLLAKEYAVQIASRVRVREEDALGHLSQLKAPRNFEEGDERDQARLGVASGLPVQSASNAGSNPRRSSLPQSEINRFRFEREFLSLMAQFPLLALERADILAQTQWHEPKHHALSLSILSTLSNDPTASTARIIGEAAQVLPEASSILTSGIMSDTAAPEPLAHFLAEELAIGDAEDALASFRAQLSDPTALPAEEYEMLFQSVTAMQKDLNQRRLSHKPLM